MLNDDHDLTHDADAMIDRNLQMLGQQLALPAEPSAAQQTAWKRPHDAPRSLRRRFSTMTRQRNIFAWTGLGSALAAAVLLAVFLFTPTPHSTVQASTIFESFADALANAFHVTIANVGDDGVKWNGKLIALNLPDSANTGNVHDAVYFEASAQGEAGSPAEGLIADGTVCFMPDNNWAYVKLANLPAAVVSSNPILGWLQGRAANGLLMEFPNSPTSTNPEQDAIQQALQNVTIPPPAAPTGTGITTSFSTTTTSSVIMKPSFTIGIAVDSSGNGTLSEEQQQALVNQCLQGGNNSTNLQTGFSFNTPGADEPLAQLFGKFVTGQATQADFDAAASYLQSGSGNVTIAETEPGLHVLTAASFDVGGDNQDGDPNGDATLQIAFREGEGVKWAELQHVGDYDGVIRFERAEVQATDPRFDRQRFAGTPGVQTMDLSNWTNLFSFLGASGGSSDADADPADGGGEPANNDEDQNDSGSTGE